jgi:Predicted metal-dependent hydrolase
MGRTLLQLQTSKPGKQKMDKFHKETLFLSIRATTNTGLTKKAYIDDGYPIFAKDAAEYIVSKKARFVGMEAISPDGPNTDTHQIFMGGGTMIIENLKGLGTIGKKRCLTMGTFPNMKGATGVLIRLLAVVDK